MAGITVAHRDLVDTQQRLGQWFEQSLGQRVTLSELEPANRAAPGWTIVAVNSRSRTARGRSSKPTGCRPATSWRTKS
jgi:hypothetical protein